MAEGYTGGGAGGDTTESATRLQVATIGSRTMQKPTIEKQSIVAKGTSNRIFGISSDSSSLATNEAMPSRIEVSNDGSCPINILTGYETYSNETTGAGATRYLHTMLLPGESFSPPVRSLISTENAKTQFDGTVSNSGVYTVPATTTNFSYDDAEVNLGAKIEDSDTQITTEANGTNAFRVGDLIQIGTTTGTTITNLEIMRVTAITSTTVMKVDRNVFGGILVDGDAQTDGTNGAVSGAGINFAYFNAYHDFNKFTVPQTDALGRFKTTNMFGLARSMSASASVGIVPGSFALKFYEPGYQEFGLNGITTNTESGLTAGSTYFVKIAIDGVTAEEISFAVDSTNTKFGGKNGIVSKLQAAIDALFYDKSKNNFELGAEVTINGGDIRVTSRQRTSSSAIALTAATSGGAASTRLFSGNSSMGRLAGSPKTAVAADLPDDEVYDNITYATTPNTKNLVYDDGRGNLLGAAIGTINYETGAFDMRNGPENASFAYLVNHSSAFSGKLNEGTTGRINSVKEILANTFSQKNGSVVLKTFK